MPDDEWSTARRMSPLVRLAGALLVEQNDEWLVGRRYLSAESLEAAPSRAAQATRTTEVSALPAA